MSQTKKQRLLKQKADILSVIKNCNTFHMRELDRINKELLKTK